MQLKGTELVDLCPSFFLSRARSFPLFLSIFFSLFLSSIFFLFLPPALLSSPPLFSLIGSSVGCKTAHMRMYLRSDALESEGVRGCHRRWEGKQKRLPFSCCPQDSVLTIVDLGGLRRMLSGTLDESVVRFYQDEGRVDHAPFHISSSCSLFIWFLRPCGKAD